MTAPGEVFENHTVLVRGGRIIELLPTAVARERYRAAVDVERSAHLLLPGLINAAAPLAGGSAAGALLRIAELLSAGTTCVLSAGAFPDESARLAAEQGLRAVIGMPIAAAPSAWAENAGHYLTRALNLRDEYHAHPLIRTAFAPAAEATLDDATLLRVATLAAELDASVVTTLHASAAAVEASLRRHGMRPIERLEALGLLSPALTAVGMAAVDATDVDRAERAGIAVALCPIQSALRGGAAGALSAWSTARVRLALGTSLDDTGASLDLWSELRYFAIQIAAGTSLAERAWTALAAITGGAAAALGLEAEIGTIEAGKWADLCCVDLRSPALLRGSLRPTSLSTYGAAAAAHARMTELTFDGGRDIVSDVWVSGRQLIEHCAFTRLDWNALAARMAGERVSTTLGAAP